MFAFTLGLKIFRNLGLRSFLNFRGHAQEPFLHRNVHIVSHSQELAWSLSHHSKKSRHILEHFIVSKIAFFYDRLENKHFRINQVVDSSLGDEVDGISEIAFLVHQSHLENLLVDQPGHNTGQKTGVFH